jgi:proteasome accessory factor C
MVTDYRDAGNDGAPDLTSDAEGWAGSSGPAGGAAVRLRRLLAILVHLANAGEASIDDLARRFDMEPEEMVAELELAACCGLPPYTPDQLIELVVDADRVFAERVGDLGRPQRLTPTEGFAVAAAAKALLAVPGADPEGILAGAVAKLDAALGEDRLVLDIDTPEHLLGLRAAVAARRQVEIEYESASRGERTVRVVDPYQVVMREGRWYLDGHCHRAEDVRRFQVDRVRSVRETGVTASGPDREIPELHDPRAFVGDAEATPTTVVAPHGAGWLLERLSGGRTTMLEDGRVEATLLVGNVRWLERIMLRLGPGAVVTSPPEFATVQATGARRALRRYRAATQPAP